MKCHFPAVINPWHNNNSIHQSQAIYSQKISLEKISPSPATVILHKRFVKYIFANAVKVARSSMYNGTSIIWTPLTTVLMLAYRISEIVLITEVLIFLTELYGA